MKLSKLVLLPFVLVPLLAGCPDEAQNDSITHLNKCVDAHGKKQYETAIAECESATKLWKGNHRAYYAAGDAYAKRNNWTEAVKQFESAVQAKDDEPMYHQVLGIALYNREVQNAKEALAKAKNKKPEEVASEVNLAVLNFEGAIQHLQRATKVNDQLWKSHYFLGRIFRDTDKPAEAAQELTKAIQSNPFEPAPYIALSELYLQWDYPDQALQVASIGTTHVPGAAERSNVWFEVGMAYHDKRQDDQAVEAFTKAIEDRKDNHPAKFQRGQAYYRKNDCPKAKKDLEEFSKAGSATEALAKQQANKMIMDCAAKQL
jgi:tetratricopeptide (TPR) repeat protein